MREDLTWLLGEEWYTEKKMSKASRRKKIYHKGIFGDSKVIKYPYEYNSFIFVTRVTQSIHDAGKFLYIPSPPSPPTILPTKMVDI